jgi:hypothetical protein
LDFICCLCVNKRVVLLRRVLFISLEILNAYINGGNETEDLSSAEGVSPLLSMLYIFSLKFNSAEARAHTQASQHPRVLVGEAPVQFFLSLSLVPVANFECALQRDARCRYSPLGQLLFLLT